MRPRYWTHGNTTFDNDDAEVNGDPEAEEDPAEESEEE